MSKFIQQNSLTEVKNSLKFVEIADLPSELFNPYRLLIMNSLYRMDYLSFSQLGHLIKIKSDGNLASHLKYLQKDGYVISEKREIGRYSRQFYQLTGKGKKMFELLVKGLKAYLATINRT